MKPLTSPHISIKEENTMADEKLEIEVLSMKSFVFRLPETGNIVVDVSVNYFKDTENNVVSEAWLHPEFQKAMMFLADVCSFANNGQSDEQIEDRLLDYYSSSEDFKNSVVALLNEDYEYFKDDHDNNDNER